MHFLHFRVSAHYSRTGRTDRSPPSDANKTNPQVPCMLHVECQERRALLSSAVSTLRTGQIKAVYMEYGRLKRSWFWLLFLYRPSYREWRGRDVVWWLMRYSAWYNGWTVGSGMASQSRPLVDMYDNSLLANFVCLPSCSFSPKDPADNFRKNSQIADIFQPRLWKAGLFIVIVCVELVVGYRSEKSCCIPICSAE